MAALGITSAAAAQNQAVIAPQPRLVRAAHEFEAQMMKELLKPMTSSDGLTGDGDGAGSGSGGALGEFASEALGKALSEQGGFGIARSIVQDLSHSGNDSHSAQVTGSLPRNTVIRSLE
jgi:Rod binding domain-containing protein